MNFRYLLAVFLTALLSLTAPFSTADAQALGLGGAPAQAAPDKDPLGRDTPRGLMFGYLQAVSTGNYELAGEYLAMPTSSEGLRLSRSSKLSQDLETLLDRAGALNDNWTISSSPDGHLSDGQKEGVDLLGRIDVGDQSVDLLAERVTLSSGKTAWQISKQTLDHIPSLLAASSHSLADRIIPGGLTNIEFFSVPAGHVLYTAAAILLLWGIIYVASVMVFRGLDRIALSRGFIAPAALLRNVREPVVTIATATLVLPTLEASGISVIMRGFISPVIDIVASVSLARIVFGVIDTVSAQAIERAHARGSVGSISFFLLLRRAAKLTIVFAAILLTLSAIGVDLTAGLAALGIGGIAIALGSQKTIEHFVGSLTVVADRVVGIGDFCRFGTTYGTVEDIGIRSTRIRTLNRTLVTIPNGVFSSTEIENYTSRDKFLFKHFLVLLPGTSRAKITYCLEGIRQILAEEPQIDPDPRRVRLVGVDQALPRIEVFAYVLAVDYNEFLLHQENLILRILALIEHSGTALSVPVQDVRISSAGAAPPPNPTPVPPRPLEPVQLPLFGRES